MIDTERVHTFIELDRRKKELAEELDRVKAELATIENALLDQFADAGMQNIKVNGTTVYLRRELWASAVDGDRGKVCQALKSAGFEDLVKEDFNSLQLSSLMREFDRNKEAPPVALQGAVSVSEVFHIRTRSS